MKLFASLFTLGILLLVTIWTCRKRSDRVSEQWRSEQERHDQQQGIDGVSIRWPIRKIVNESAQFNSAKLRKRA